MLKQFAKIFLTWIIFGISSYGRAQGKLEAILMPLAPSTPQLAGQAIVLTPTISSGDVLYPVLFEIHINSDQSVFTTGRIFGGGTAWAFALGIPTIENGSMSFKGSTDMTSTQIDDMLADRTQIEVMDELGSTSHLSGSLGFVPEPSCGMIVIVGFCALAFRSKRSLLQPATLKTT